MSQPIQMFGYGRRSRAVVAMVQPTRGRPVNNLIMSSSRVGHATPSEPRTRHSPECSRRVLVAGCCPNAVNTFVSSELGGKDVAHRSLNSVDFLRARDFIRTATKALALLTPSWRPIILKACQSLIHPRVLRPRSTLYNLNESPLVNFTYSRTRNDFVDTSSRFSGRATRHWSRQLSQSWNCR